MAVVSSCFYRTAHVTEGGMCACSVWHSPGPDMMTSTGVADVQAEINDAIDPCKFTLYVKPVNETIIGQLEVHYLSTHRG